MEMTWIWNNGKAIHAVGPIGMEVNNLNIKGNPLKMYYEWKVTFDFFHQ